MIHQRVMLPPRGALTGWKMGQQDLREFQKVKYKILHLGDNKPTWQYTLGGHTVGKDQIHHDLKEVCRVRPFSVVCSDRTKISGHQQKHGIFILNNKKHL